MVAPVRLTITIAALRWRRACDLDARIAELTARLGRVPADDELLSLLEMMGLPLTSTKHALWALRVAEPAEDAHFVSVTVAVRAARRVEHLFPAEGRDACIAALVAAEAWIADPTRDHAKAADTARSAARAAAADAAADAADTAAYAAANAAADAAACAYAATFDYTAATYAADACANAARAADNADNADAAAWASARADLASLLIA